jgi:predicted DNA-binding protein with PD1-like motif
MSEDQWWKDEAPSEGYYSVEAKRGREFILRMITGADLVKTIQKFAKDKNIKIAKIHAAFMGGLQPARYLVWAPDTKNPDNWANEVVAELHNLSMILSMSGIIQPNTKGGTDPVVKIHFVTGGGWDCPTVGGHLAKGSIVKGMYEVYITELLGLEIVNKEGVEDWFREV